MAYKLKDKIAILSRLKPVISQGITLLWTSTETHLFLNHTKQNKRTGHGKNIDPGVFPKD